MASKSPNCGQQEDAKHHELRLDFLQQRVIEIIVTFLEFSDKLNLRATNKTLTSKMSKHFNLNVANLCFSKFFPKEIDSFCEYGDQPIFIKDKLVKDQKIILDNHLAWKLICTKHAELLDKWNVVINGILPNQEDTNQRLIRKIQSIFKEPPLPLLKLRRENVGRYSNSWLQNLLCEELTQNYQIIGLKFFDDENEFTTLTTFFKHPPNKQMLIKQMFDYVDEAKGQQQAANRQVLLAVRWLIYSDLFENNPENQSWFEIDNKLERDLKLQQSSSKIRPIDNVYHPCAHSMETEEYKQQQRGCEMHIEQNFDLEMDSCDDLNLPCMDMTHLKSKQPIYSGWPQVPPKIQLDIDALIDDESAPLLLRFMLLLVKQVKFQVFLVKHYLMMHLQAFGNAYDFISEYNIKYISYVASLYELKENVQDIFEVFNEAYEHCMPEFPLYPKFTISRLMVKVWINDIFKQNGVKEKLMLFYNKILQSRRVENFKFSFGQCKVDKKLAQQYYMPDQTACEEERDIMSAKLILTSNFSMKIQQKDALDFNHDYFYQDSYQTDTLLSSLAENLMDISINEVSVHYLGHTEIDTEEPYNYFNEQVIKYSTEFYEYQLNLYKDSENQLDLELYKQFLEDDYKYIKKLVKEKTLVAIKQIQLKIWNEQFQKKFNQQLLQFEAPLPPSNSSKGASTLHAIQTYAKYPMIQQYIVNFLEANSAQFEKILLSIKASEALKPRESTQLPDTGIVLDMEQQLPAKTQQLEMAQRKSNPLLADVAKFILNTLDKRVKLDKEFQIYENNLVEMLAIAANKIDQNLEIEELNQWRQMRIKLTPEEDKFYQINNEDLTRLFIYDLVNQNKQFQQEKNAEDDQSDTGQNMLEEYNSEGNKTQAKQKTKNTEDYDGELPMMDQPKMVKSISMQESKVNIQLQQIQCHTKTQLEIAANEETKQVQNNYQTDSSKQEPELFYALISQGQLTAHYSMNQESVGISDQIKESPVLNLKQIQPEHKLLFPGNQDSLIGQSPLSGSFLSQIPEFTLSNKYQTLGKQVNGLENTNKK